MKPTVALAYSGGVDTSICIYWLESKGFKVITLQANLGQAEYLEPIGEKAVGIGATTTHIKDLRERFIKEFIWPALKANARYEGKYFLSCALNRPLLAEELVRLAEEENCEYVAHGSRGLGNDYIRFENAFRVLAPHLKIIAPMKELGLKSPQEDIKYAQKHNIPIESKRLALYNIEQTLWGVNIQLGPWSNQWKEADRDTYIMTIPLSEVEDKPTIIEIGFSRGEPISLNKKKMDPIRLIEILNKIGGRNAIGRVDMLENKISGLKSREIYEAPAATILYTAHQALEEAILPKEVLHFKEGLSQKYAELVYEGHWFSSLRSALDKFFLHIQTEINGQVKLKLYKGNLLVMKIKK